MRKNIIITGIPKSGKSTLVRKVIKDYKNKVGFLANEIVKNNQRIGFEIETYLGKKAVLAHRDFETAFLVGKYYVNVDNLDEIVLDVGKFGKGKLLFLDEVGQMDLFSDKFRQLVLQYLNSQNICLMTMSAIYDDKLITSIKNREDVIVIKLNKNNRTKKRKFVQELIKKIAKAKKYSQEQSRFKLADKGVVMNSENGARQLKKESAGWVCNCDFFEKNKICSHVIALESVEHKII